jgi:hypothetical protein
MDRIVQCRAAMTRKRGASVPPVTALVSSPDVDDVVWELRQLHCASGLKLAVSVGRLVLDRIYGGDVARWRSRGRKDSSFRTLASHPELPFSASTLSRSVGIYLMAGRRPDLLALPNLGPSHVRELLGLRSDLQDHFLDQVAEQGWSVQRLREEVSRLGSTGPTRLAKRREAPPFARCLRQLRHGIEARALLEGAEHADLIAPDEAEELLGVARQLCVQAETIVGRLSESLAKRQNVTLEPPAAGVAADRPSGISARGVSTWKRSRSSTRRG